MKRLLWVIAALAVAAAPAGAALGEYEHSVALDQQHVGGHVREIARQGYHLQEIRAPHGTVIREYVSPAGRVFGIAWQSPVMPDLEQLLGSYYGQFQEIVQSGKRRHGPLIVRTDEFVVESGGHARAFHGRAYVPSLMPAGVTPEAVQ
jgi:Protein of unknown function (DUF2844)